MSKPSQPVSTYNSVEDKANKKFETIREILERPSKERTVDDLAELSGLISSISFFQEKNIKEKDMLELMTVFQFSKIKAGKDVMVYNESGDLFYLSIKGNVSVRIPNMSRIRGWRSHFNEFNKLKVWIERLTSKFFIECAKYNKK